jgi:hypothetical protein
VKLAGRGSVPRCTDDEGVGQVAVPDRDLAYSLKRPAGRYWRCSDLRNRVIELLEPTRRGGKVLRRPTPASVLRRWLRLAGRIGLALVSATTLILTGYAWTLSRQLNASPTTSAVLDHPSSTDRVGSAGFRPTAAIGRRTCYLWAWIAAPTPRATHCLRRCSRHCTPAVTTAR